MSSVLKVTLENGVPIAGDGEVDTLTAVAQDGGLTTIGHRADQAESLPNTVMQAMKQTSKSLQTIKSLLPLVLGSGGGLKIDTSGEPIHATWTQQGPAQIRRGHSTTVQFLAGTDTFDAWDCIGPPTGNGALPFYDVADDPGVIEITRVAMRINRASLLSGEANYWLRLYNGPPPSALMVGTAFDLTTADRPYFLGEIELGTPTDIGSTLFCDVMPFKCVKLSSRNLFAYLVNSGTHTVQAVEYFLTMHARRW